MSGLNIVEAFIEVCSRFSCRRHGQRGSLTLTDSQRKAAALEQIDPVLRSVLPLCRTSLQPKQPSKCRNNWSLTHGTNIYKVASLTH